MGYVMSVRVMAAVFEADTGSPISKLVLLALADHAADDGTSVYPSVATISRKADLSERACQDALRRLEGQNGQPKFIELEQEAVHHKTRRYRIMLEALRGARRAPLDIRGAAPAPLDRSGVREMPARGAAAAPNPSGEPSATTNHQENLTPAKADATPIKTPGALLYDAYEAAYLKRYGTKPLQPGHRTRSIFKRLATEVLPAEEAAPVVASYLENEDPLYVRAKHQVALLVRDIEKIRTEWATRTAVPTIGRHRFDPRDFDGQKTGDVL